METYSLDKTAQQCWTEAKENIDQTNTIYSEDELHSVIC